MVVRSLACVEGLPMDAYSPRCPKSFSQRVADPGNRLVVSVPEAMTDPRLRRYRLRRLRIPIGAGQVDLVVPDARAWLREGAWVGATERGAEPPYWVNVWPASVAVARCLVR